MTYKIVMTLTTLNKSVSKLPVPPISTADSLKIAIARRHYSLQRGGAERYCVNLSRQLQRLGHDVTFVGEGIDEELREELPILSVPVNSTTSSTRNRSFAENCAKTVAGEGFDIVYGLGRSLGVDLFRVTERLQAHWVNVRYRNSVHRFIQHRNPRHRTMIDLERSICLSPQTRRIVTISSVDGELLKRYYGVPDEKIRTIYNGVDRERFHPRVRETAGAIRHEWGIGAEDPLLVFAAMDFAGKGLRTILEAMRSARNRDIRLLVLGKGPERKFARIARRLGVHGRVTFAGRQDQVERYYGAGDLLVLPTTYEPFPNVILESMACGVPAMTTATAGGSDVIDEEQTGYVLPHSEAIAELSERLDHHFAKTTAERDMMAAACREKTRGMTMENNARQVADLFAEVVREKHRV